MLRRSLSTLLLALTLILAAGAFSALTMQKGSAQRAPVTTPTPGLTITSGYWYYAIHGRSAAALRVELNRLGPVDPSGKRFDAVTKWWVSWQYRSETKSGMCAIASVDVLVKLRFTYPRWKKPARPTAALVRKWNRYLKALSIHEEGHAKNAVQAGNRILRGIRAQAPRSSCAALSSAANTLGRREVKRANDADVAYDARTRHGATQGAIFA
jgi:predicted secreted Zn-dependent protease